MNQPKKIFVIACEISADSHGGKLIRNFKKIHPELEFRGVGGPKMKEAGMTVLSDMTQFSALGLGDVVRQYFKYRSVFYRALNDLEKWRPDALILIDSPAFNLRFAKKVKKKFPRLEILYYIAPQIWAWGYRRIHTVKKTVSKMFSIFPFEVPFYESAGISCSYVGHPSLEELSPVLDRNTERNRLGVQNKESAIGLLPGSRQNEIERILPIMLETAVLLTESLANLRFFIARSPNVSENVYRGILSGFKIPITFFQGNLYKNLRAMDFALVTSGTATLQTALVETPFFLLYKTGWSTYWLARHLVRVPYLGIVNLLAQKSIVPEFIQHRARARDIAQEAKELLTSQSRYAAMKKELQKVRELLEKEAKTSDAADAMWRYLTRQEAAMETPVLQPLHGVS